MVPMIQKKKKKKKKKRKAKVLSWGGSYVSVVLSNIVIISLGVQRAGRFADRLLVYPYFEPRHEKTCRRGFATM